LQTKDTTTSDFRKAYSSAKKAGSVFGRPRRGDSAKRHKLSAPFSPTALGKKTSTQIQRLYDVIIESAGGDPKNCV
jgi:hypothetical protein